MGKYMPPIYFADLLDKWSRITQGNRPVKEYVTEFDKFLTRYNIRGMQSDIQIFSQFRDEFRINLKYELCKHEIIELKKLMSWSKI